MNPLDLFILKSSFIEEKLTEIHLDNHRVLVQVHGTKEDRANNRIKKIVISRYDKICKRIARNLKDLARTWQEEYGVEVYMSEEEFIKKLKPILIDFRSDRSVSMLFDATNMFGDRRIEVIFKRSGKIESIGLANPED